LREQDLLRFSDAVEASLDVWSRQQFFVWTQGAVQGLVPHEILICGVRVAGRQPLLMQRFNAGRYFQQGHFDAVSDPQSGLLPRVIAVSKDTGECVVFSPPGTDRISDLHLHALVQANEMQNLAGKLVLGLDRQIEAFYGFSRVSVSLDERLGRLIDLMVPHLHSTFLRVLSNERLAPVPEEPVSVRIVTRRQAEILLLVKEGKTNAEIAELLECSQWTIKNHVQNILRRLDASSRAHALSRAMQLGILRPD
jgi:transcriptional regulator EpsA